MATSIWALRGDFYEKCMDVTNQEAKEWLKEWQKEEPGVKFVVARLRPRVEDD